MSINAVAGLNNNTASSAATTNLAEDFDTFLTLLTTQLQNQDPLEPTDTETFVQQLTQFTEVEQSIATNQNLELLVGLSQAASGATAVSYLGQDVVANGAESQLDNGEARWTYDIARDSSTVRLTILNENGIPVHEADGNQTSGQHDFTWDGKSSNGTTLPDGLYTLQVRAEDAAGNSVITNTTIRGRVSAVDFSGSDPVLTVDGVSVPMRSVRELRTAS